MCWYSLKYLGETEKRKGEKEEKYETTELSIMVGMFKKKSKATMSYRNFIGRF